MIYIAHRGNTNGPNKELENSPNYIDTAIENGFNVEVDVWYKDKDAELWLGHDEPQYKISLQFLLDRFNVLWIHCKHIYALEYLIQFNKLHIFWHEQDVATLTSKKYIWMYPGATYYPQGRSINVMPEWEFTNISEVKHNILITSPTYIGICSDYVNVLRSDT